MGKNYYAILNVSRTATDVELKQAFRKQALIWHPDRNTQDPLNARVRFDDICEAFSVLISQSSRAIYDLYGEQVLKRGLPDGEGGYQNGWAKTQSNDELFLNFFGSNNPFMVDGKLTGRPIPLVTPATIEPIKSVIYATYEEIYAGVTRLVTLSRQVYDVDRKQLIDQQITFKVPIEKGAVDGTRIVFEGAGNQQHDQCGNVEFEIRMAPHPIYRREGYDLIVSRDLFISEALTGGVVRVPTLDERVLSVPISKVVVPGDRIRISGEGLRQPNGRPGDLYIEFAVRYPQDISMHQKQELKRQHGPGHEYILQVSKANRARSGNPVPAGSGAAAQVPEFHFSCHFGGLSSCQGPRQFATPSTLTEDVHGLA